MLPLQFLEPVFVLRLHFSKELLSGLGGPGDRVKIDLLVLAPELGAAHPGALEASQVCSVEQNIRNQDLLDLCLFLDARRRIDNISENVTVFDEAQSGVQAHPNVDLFDFRASLTIPFQRPLHPNGSPDRGYRIFKASHDRIADGLHDTAACAFDLRKQHAVMAIDHRHAFDIALLFEIRRGSLDIAEENGDTGAQLFQLLLGLRSDFQQFFEFVLIHHLVTVETGWIITKGLSRQCPEFGDGAETGLTPRIPSTYCGNRLTAPPARLKKYIAPDDPRPKRTNCIVYPPPSAK